MRYLILVIGFLWFFSTLSGQDTTILKAELVQLEQTKDYPAYTESLLQLVYQYELAQLPDRALFYVEKGQAFLPKENEASHHKLNYKWHVLTFEKGAMDAGRVFHLDSAYASLQRFADEATIISFLKYYAYRQQSCLLYQEGHQTLQLLQEKCESQDSLSHHLVEIYNQLQRSAKDLGEFEAALDYIRKGIEASQASEDYAYIVNLYIDNGVLLGMLGMDGVYESYQKALEVARSKGTEREVASVQISLASHYNAQEEPVKALEALKESKTIFSKLGEKTALISINTEMANAYFELGNIEKGMQLFEENIQLCDADYQSSCSTIYYRYAYRLDSIAPIDTLITLLEKQIALSKQLQDRPILASSYEFLYGLYKDKADFSNALYYLEEAKQLQDSLNTAQLDAKLAEEGTRQKVETFQTQKEAAEQESRVLSYRNRLFVGFSLVLLGLLVLTLFLITQLRKTRKRLATQNERLAQLNTTKDRFFGIIAHDIRSPITALSNVGEQMDYYLVKNNLLKLKRLSGRIDKTAQKLTRLLDNLLNWALLQNGMIPYHPQSIDVHGIVAENLLLYQEIAETKGIQLHNEVEPGTMVFVDESATSTIVRNLINNAVKFTASGGTVEVSTEDKGDQVFIRINDTGTGISAEKLPTIFSLKGSRSRGTNQESGTGLGLMLCKDLVELNKGTIRVDSELGKGSSFIVSLPRKKVG